MSSPIRSLLLMSAAACLLSTASAQVKLNGFGGYTFQDRFNLSGAYNGFSYSEGVLGEGAHFGGSIEFELRPHKSIELLYRPNPEKGICAVVLWISVRTMWRCIT
ncbi:MAG: hypothetical protein R2818_02810 [Flavobacteriales bacterium]